MNMGKRFSKDGKFMKLHSLYEKLLNKKVK